MLPRFDSATLLNGTNPLSIQSVHLQDFKGLPQIPCVRPAFLYGIGSGFALAGIQLAVGASLRKASTWAVGSFVGVSIVVFEGCHYKYQQEKERVRLIQEAMDKRAKAVAEDRAKKEMAAKRRAIQAKEREEKERREREKWFWQR
jgi:cytochrome c oxidase assembly protein subunit 20